VPSINAIPDPGLERLNRLPTSEARSKLLACCDVPGWADGVLRGRPYASRRQLWSAADGRSRRLTDTEVERAMAAHPRIGDRSSGPGTEAQWSRDEQRGVGLDVDTRAGLASGNLLYERKFGRVFLICASGMSADDILIALRERLENDPEREHRVVADELRKIALLRLGKVLDGLSAEEGTGDEE
jgi:OHCU decarboxylase